MATVTKRNSKWYAIYQDSTGKQCWKAGYHDKQETQRLADRLEDEHRRIRLGDIDPQIEARRIERAKLLTQHVSDYRATLEAAGRNPYTIMYVIGDIEALVDFASSEGQPLASASAITRPLIDRWILAQKKCQKSKVKGNSNKTINRRVGSIQQFLKHLQGIGGVTEYILHKYPKLPTGDHHQTRKTRALTADELEALLTCPAIPEARRQRYTVAARSGLRMNELRQMIGRYFASADSLIHIPAHIAKAKKDQSVPMHPSIAAIVNRIAADALICPAMPTKQHVINQLRADAKAAGIGKPDALGFHTFRHTFCTMLARANVHPALLQKLARHADIKTTLGYYVHLQRSDELAAINML